MAGFEVIIEARKQKPGGGIQFSVSGDPVEARKIVANVKRANEAKGRTFEVHDETEQRIEQPRITGHFTVDLLALGRFPVKVALGFGHWLWGPDWSRGSEAERLRRALWGKSIDELNGIGLACDSAKPADLGLKVDDFGHVFLVSRMVNKGCALGIFFFGQPGSVLNMVQPTRYSGVEGTAVVLNVNSGVIRRTSLIEFCLERRGRRREPTAT